MNKIVFALLIGISIVGCTNTDDGNRPIVSPDNISTESGNDSEPSIPYYKPIWEK